MADFVLGYQRSMVPTVSAVRRRVAAMLRIAAVALVAFALILGLQVIEYRVKELAWGPWAFDADRGVWARHVITVYHWDQLLWVAAAMVGPLLLAGAYWFLGRAIGKRTDRTLTVAALVLAMLHTLGASLCAWYFILIGFGNLRFNTFSFLMAQQVAGSFLALAMAPGMFYVSLRLMDLFGEKTLPSRSTQAVDGERPK